MYLQVFYVLIAAARGQREDLIQERHLPAGAAEPLGLRK